MSPRFSLRLFPFLAALAAAVPARAVLFHGESPQQPPPPPPVIQREGDRIRVGSVWIENATRAVVATGWVNQTSGLIEVLACGPQGKLHESLFCLQAGPLDFQTAMLLAGFKPGASNGTPVSIEVEWRGSNGVCRLPAAQMVSNVENRCVLPDGAWIFTGSRIENGAFRALIDQGFVATYWDDWAIVNLNLPCATNDTILCVNEARVPPAETPVTLRFRTVRQPSATR